MLKDISAAEARNKIGELLEKSHYGHKTFRITRRGRPFAILMGIDEYETLIATLEEYADPKALNMLKEAEADVAANHTYSWEEVFGEAYR